MKEELEYLKDRAVKFFDYGAVAFDKGDYDIAAFHFEQSSQLYLKYTLGLILGDFPKTHSLYRLIEAVFKATQKELFKNLVEENANLVADLESAI